MKKSVIIIAHNEERYIEKCIQSILNQTQKPDGVILVAHNCSDRTIAIAKKYPVQVVIFNESPGIVYARLKGIDSVTGDIIFCIDGDSFAENNWIEILSETLVNNILVGSWVKFNGSFLNIINNKINKYLCVTKNKQALCWVWGPSFAFYAKDKFKISNALNKSVELSKKLNLTRNPDDHWMSEYLSREGDIEVTNKTFVTQNTKENGFVKEIFRNIENIRNGWKIKSFLKNQSL